MTRCLPAILMLLAITGCAAMKNTLAQDLAWERWQKCSGRYPTIQLKEIRTDGQIFLWTHYGSDWDGVRQCLRDSEREQAARRAAPVDTKTVAAPSARPAELWNLPTWNQGDEWAFRWESPRGSGTFVWSVDRVEDGYYVVRSGTREIYWRVNDFAYYMDKVGGQVETRRVGNNDEIPWPLTPGKTWMVRATEERPQDRQTRDLRHACGVEAEELVTVPAGRFQTVKIVCRDDRTQAIVVEMWYASAVKHWVRERGRFEYGVRERELIEYRLK